MLSRRREREIQMQEAMKAQAYRIEASKRGAIAVLAACAGLGFLVGFIAERIAL